MTVMNEDDIVYITDNTSDKGLAIKHSYNS